MGRHGVPGAAGSELGHTHLQLAARHDFLYQQAVDGALVALFEAAEVHHHRILLANLLDSGLLVGGGGAEVEVGGLGGIIAAEGDVPVAATYIQGFLIIEMEDFFSDLHAAGAADIDDPELAALGKIVSPEDLRSAQQQIFLHRNRSAGDYAVEHRIYHIDFVRHHKVLHQILLADTPGVVMLGIYIARCLPDFAIDFHIYFGCFPI